jgi:hypothetical protein
LAHWNQVHIPGRTGKRPVIDDALGATKIPLRPSHNQGYDEHDIRTGLTQTTYSTHIPLLTSSSKGGAPTLTTRWTDIGSRPASPLLKFTHSLTPPELCVSFPLKNLICSSCLALPANLQAVPHPAPSTLLTTAALYPRLKFSLLKMRLKLKRISS